MAIRRVVGGGYAPGYNVPVASGGSGYFLEGTRIMGPEIRQRGI